MTTATAETRQLSKLDADTLAGLYCAGRIDLSALLAVDRADVAAGKAKARQAAERAAWLDAAYAQYEQASAYCQGNLFSRFALAEYEARAAWLAARRKPAPPMSDGMVLWRCSDAWAERRASPELRNFWERNGGRLSWAAWQEQQAMQARAYRDERDLAAMPAPSARDLAEQAAAAPRTAAQAPGSIADYITALGHLGRQAETTARALARVNGGIQR